MPDKRGYRKCGVLGLDLSGFPTNRGLPAADTKDICTTFAQLWQTPALAGLWTLEIEGDHLSVSALCTAASWS